jgi:hypothetical protein
MPFARLEREQGARSGVDDVRAGFDACFPLDNRQPGPLADLVVA